MHIAADRVGQGFGEIVVYAVFTAQQLDLADDVGVHHDAARGAVDLARLRADAEVPQRLRFHHAEFADRQLVELVVAQRVGDGGQAGRNIRGAVEHQQRQVDVAQALLTSVLMVVQVLVDEHHAGDRVGQRNLLGLRHGAAVKSARSSAGS